MATASKSLSSGASDNLFNLVWLGAILYGIGYFLQQAYIIRLQAINEYGPVIHEFDPYFNWRATQVCFEIVVCNAMVHVHLRWCT